MQHEHQALGTTPYRPSLHLQEPMLTWVGVAELQKGKICDCSSQHTALDMSEGQSQECGFTEMVHVLSPAQQHLALKISQLFTFQYGVPWPAVLEVCKSGSTWYQQEL